MQVEDIKSQIAAAVKEEDYVTAAKLKKELKSLEEAALEAAAAESVDTATERAEGAASQIARWRENEKSHLAKEIAAAVEAEDYHHAAELKKKLKALEAAPLPAAAPAKEEAKAKTDDSESDDGEVVTERGIDNQFGWACINGHEQGVQVYFEKGAEVNCRFTQKMRPIHKCGQGFYDHPFIAKFLIENGADIHARDEFKRTALHWAADQGNIEVIRELVNAGADLNALDKFGYTPQMVAEEYKRKHKGCPNCDQWGTRDCMHREAIAALTDLGAKAPEDIDGAATGVFETLKL